MPGTNNRIHNWSEYNNSLVQRGSITVWFNVDCARKWHSQSVRKPGGKVRYTHFAIETSLVIKEVYRLTYRACEGFMQSLIACLKLTDVKITDYTTLCRRAKSHKISFSRSSILSKELCVLVDSTGIRVYGKTEWYKTKHKRSERQQWRKLHIAVDHSAQMILSAEVTDGYVHDATHFGSLVKKIDQTNRIKTFIGDGAYSLARCHRAAQRMGAKILAPPHINARKHIERRRSARHKIATPERDQAIDFVRSYASHAEGLSAWKSQKNYHRRSLVETQMFRLKSQFGDSINAKTLSAQKQILMIRCAALNKMTTLGLPKRDSKDLNKT